MSRLLINPTAVILLFISILALVHGTYRHHRSYDHPLHVTTSPVLDVESIKQQGGESFVSTVLPTQCGNFNVQIWSLPQDMYELCAHHAHIHHWQFEHTQPNPPNTAYERPMAAQYSHVVDTGAAATNPYPHGSIQAQQSEPIAAARNPYPHRGIQAQQSEPALDVLTYASRILDDTHSQQDVDTLKGKQGTILMKLRQILDGVQITTCALDTVETESEAIRVATQIKSCLGREYEKIENINLLLGDLLAITVIIRMIGERIHSPDASTMHQMPVTRDTDVQQRQMEILRALSEAIQRNEVLGDVGRRIWKVNQDLKWLEHILRGGGTGTDHRAITLAEVEILKSKIHAMIQPFNDDMINNELLTELANLEATTAPQAVHT